MQSIARMLSPSSFLRLLLQRGQLRRSAATIVNGTAIAARVKDDLRLLVSSARTRHGGVPPGLAMILVGSRGDSVRYVENKRRACHDVGIYSVIADYPSTVTAEELAGRIQALNSDASIHGILVQLPLPPHLDEHVIINGIDPSKDVDGLTAINIARLTFRKIAPPKTHETSSFMSTDFHVSCTAQGCIEIIDKIGVPIEGARALVLGRSNIVGLPTALLLMQRNATVTIAHSRSEDMASLVGEADIVVVAIGRPEFLRGSWLKPGAVVVDVGINLSAPTEGGPPRLLGDAHFTSCREAASFITPAPGGVGPMTIAMLLRNTVNSYLRSLLR